MSSQSHNPTGRAVIWAVTGLLQINLLNLQAAGESAGVKLKGSERNLEQKLALIERVLYQSPLGKQAANNPSELDPAIYETWLSARLAFELAVEALKEQNGENAIQSLDSALSLYREASAMNRRASKADVDFNARLADLKSRVQSYRDSLDRIAQEKNIRVADGLEKNKFDEALATAERHEKQGDMEKAVQVLQVLQSNLESELIVARRGETLVSSVEFTSLEEAYEYEIKKYASKEQLLELLSGNNMLSDGSRLLVARYLREIRDASARAMQKSKEGNFEAALQALESGAAAQTNALSLFGINM